jgi:hypothetical protein
MKVLFEILVGLLETKDCVIMPGFGAFVANYKSSKIDSDSGIIYPPSRQFVFNRHVANNDGLLVSRYSDLKGLGYNEALIEIEELNSILLETIESEGRLEIKDFGFLFLNEEGVMLFEQNISLVIGLESKGYFPIRLDFLESKKEIKSLINVVEKEDVNVVVKKKVVSSITNNNGDLKIVNPIKTLKEKGDEETMYIEPKKTNVYLSILRSAAVILPLVYYSFVLNENDVFSKSSISITDLIPFKKSVKVYYPKDSYLDDDYLKENKIFNFIDQIKLQENKIYEQKQIVEVVPVEISSRKSHNKTEKIEIKRTIKTNPLKTNDHHIIVGCFSTKINAQKKTSQLKGSFILDYNKGLYRVSAKCFNSKEKANEYRFKNSKSLGSSWVYSRK